jgi:nucleoside-triphosphatase
MGNKLLLEMKLLITGLPRSGKTTLCKRIIDSLGSEYKVGGMLTEEIKEGGVRKGFKLVDLARGKEGVLAHVNRGRGPRIGRYRVNLRDLEDIGEKAILHAIDACDLIVIDEVGPMELHSKRFIEAVGKAFNSDKHVMATVHFKSRHALIEKLKNRKDVTLVEIDESNRDALVEKLMRFEG